MKFYNSAYTQDIVSDEYLGQRLLAFPEIKKTLIREVCEPLALCLLERVLGYGRSVTEADLKNKDKMYIAASHISWAIQPWLRQLFTVVAAPVGDGSGDSTITFTFAENWGTPGMVLLFGDVATGDFVNVILTSSAETASGGYSYTGKLLTSDAEATFDEGLAEIGSKVGWSYEVSAQCADTATKIPMTFPAWYQNYTTHKMTFDKLCSSGLQQVLWIEGVDGSRCWQPWEEYQMFQQFLKSMEFAGWYGISTVDSDGNILVTDGDGNQLQAGDGVFRQVATGNDNTYSVATYNTPAQYENFLTYIENTITDWAIQNGLTAGIELDVWAGIKAYTLLQRVLKDYANQSHGPFFIKDYESGTVYEYKLGAEFRQYYFAGFTLNLKKCAVFDDISVLGAKLPGQSAPQESWKFVIMPDTTCDGTPLIQVYFRAGCGIENAFIHKVIPGTINPLDLTSSVAVNKFKGYEVFYDTEFVFIVNDPSKILVFKGIA